MAGVPAHRAPYHPSPAPSKPLIQPRVQGRNPARFNGGYGVPRGFKGGSKPSAPCGRLSEAEHPKRKEATLLRPLSAVNRNLPGNSHSRASAPCDFRFPPCFFPHSGRMAPIPLIPRPSGARACIARRLCNRSPVLPPQRPPSSREGDRPQAVEGVPLPHSVEKVSSLHLTGFTRRSKPPVLPPIAYRGFAITPITLRTPSQRYLLIPPAPVLPPQRPPSSREGDRPQAVEGVLPHSVESVYALNPHSTLTAYSGCNSFAPKPSIFQPTVEIWSSGSAVPALPAGLTITRGFAPLRLVTP